MIGSLEQIRLLLSDRRKNEFKRTNNQNRKPRNKIKERNNEHKQCYRSGGGVQSTSVAEVPENITKMLGNYKKIAIIEMNEELPISNSYPSYPQKTVKFPQIAFKPTRFLCYIEELAGEKNKFVLDSNEKDGTYKKPRGYCRTATVELNSFTQTTASFTAYGGIGGSGDGIFRTKLYKIIAIE